MGIRFKILYIYLKIVLSDVSLIPTCLLTKLSIYLFFPPLTCHNIQGIGWILKEMHMGFEAV